MRLLRYDKLGNLSFTKNLSKSELSRFEYKYAILSHRWGKHEEEVTYKDILDGIGTTKPGVGSEKIRFCVQQTQKDDIQHFWVDTCCIDKTNNVELSESLISMFRWYSQAERCYVYLSDVPQTDEVGAEWEQDFQHSAWFKRGWTLQELIAPPQLTFYDKYGRKLGTKSSLEPQINDITGIPIAALQGKARRDFTRHERWQWQQGRETYQPEDLVYSLLGLLDISMQVLYGEGRDRARQRLEHEISIAQKGKRYQDFSLTFSLSEAVVEAQHFVARQKELQAIYDYLGNDNSQRIVVLQGLGGIGKTQLAIAYAKRFRDNYSAILWLNAKDEVSIRSSFVRVAKQIAREQPTSALHLTSLNIEEDLDEIIDEVKTWLSIPLNTRWLLICDNYDNPRLPGDINPGALDLRWFLPEVYQGSILVTTRSAEVKLGHSIQIQNLEKLQDSLSILENTSLRTITVDDVGAVELARRLDGLPLALATAGAYLSQSAVTCSKYLDFFDTSWARLQKLSPALMSYEDRTLFSTWQISFDQVERRNSVAAHLLRFWAYFDNQDLWYELLAHLKKESVPWMRELVEDELAFRTCIQVLCDYGFVNVNAENEFEIESRGYSVHPIVHEWICAVLDTQEEAELAAAALSCVASHLPKQDLMSWPLMQRRLLSHANRCVSRMSDNKYDVWLHWAFHNLGLLYTDQDKLKKAEEMYKRALSGRERVLGAEHTSTLDTVNNLGLLHARQGKLKQAEALYRRALEGREKVLGVEHTLTLDTINNLGVLYADQRKLLEAEVLYTRALAGKSKALSAEHTSTLDTINNIGNLYKDQGKLEQAEAMFMRALAGNEKALGPEHTSTLTTVHNLGNLYKDQGKLEQAEAMYMRALAGKEKALGPEHTLTLTTVHNLGNLYRDQGKLEAAETMYTLVLAGYEKVLGAEHTSTLDVIVCLGHLRIKQERVEDAKALCHRVKVEYDKMDSWLQSHVNHLELSLSEYDTATHIATAFDHETASQMSTQIEHPHGSSSSNVSNSNDDVQSLFSLTEDSSQSSTGKISLYMLAEMRVAALLAENGDMRRLCMQAALKMDAARLQRNLRRLLNAYYGALLKSTNQYWERRAIAFLRHRTVQGHVAQKVLQNVLPEDDEQTQPLRAEMQPNNTKVEDWLEHLKRSTVRRDADELVEALPSHTEYRNSHDDSDCSSVSSSEASPELSSLPNTTHMEQILMKGLPFRQLLVDMQSFLICAEHKPLIRLLMTIPSPDIWFERTYRQTWSDRLKEFFERLSQNSWNWWPFESPQSAIIDGKTRIYWRCHCSRILWHDVDRDAEDDFKSLVKVRGAFLDDRHLCLDLKKSRCNKEDVGKSLLESLKFWGWKSVYKSSIQIRPTTTTAATTTTTTTMTTGQSSFAHTNSMPNRPAHTNPVPSSALGPSDQDVVISADHDSNASSVNITVAPTKFILYGVPVNEARLELVHISTKPLNYDGELFEHLKSEYQRAQGWLKRWFSIWVLSHCDFVKFEKYRPSHFVARGSDLPVSLDYEYDPRHPSAQLPPISKHEFINSFEACAPKCYLNGLHKCRSASEKSTALRRIPKKSHEWLLAEDIQQCEYAWGLEAKRDFSVLRVLLYNIFILVGPFAFWAFWQKKHPTDMQNAVVPATVTIGMIGVFWTISGVIGVLDSARL